MKRPPIKDWRLWWFSRLDVALDRGDDRSAKEALRNLERLGIEIRFTLPFQPKSQRCPLFPKGEQCALEAGHGGGCKWANGD